MLLDLGDGRTLRVSGQIDRIDERADRTLVLRDYKTGKAPKDEGGIFRGGKQLQIPFYILAAASSFRDSRSSKPSSITWTVAVRSRSIPTWFEAKAGRPCSVASWTRSAKGCSSRSRRPASGATSPPSVVLARCSSAGVRSNAPIPSSFASCASETSDDPLPVDDHERERVRRDLDMSFVLEAGAGTGKTTLLVDRVVALVLTGRARLDQIAAVTFTENAATTMKLRVRERLERARAEGTGEERTRAAAALDTLERAPISTIHALAAALLQERPFESGVLPGFRWPTRPRPTSSSPRPGAIG
jgi:hypothetical protein